jgi:GTP-binding protein Era
VSGQISPDKLDTQCGYIAIVGRPNVGKSTLLNHLVKQKISITSRKPQTTRTNILGIRTDDKVQMIFVDTPGMHSNQEKAINRYMNRVAYSATLDVDVVIFVVERDLWTDEDARVLDLISNSKCPVIVAVNKVDKVADKSALMPIFAAIAEKFDAAEIIPVSALKEQNLDLLEKEIIRRLPPCEHIFPADQVTDKSMRFMAAEIVREKIIRQLGAELPYQVAVEIEDYADEGGIVHITAAILTEREGQKRIIIGEKGERIKKIGIDARKDLEVMLDVKVMLKLWVKVMSGWSDNARALRSLGLDL